MHEPRIQTAIKREASRSLPPCQQCSALATAGLSAAPVLPVPASVSVAHPTVAISAADEPSSVQLRVREAPHLSAPVVLNTPAPFSGSLDCSAVGDAVNGTTTWYRVTVTGRTGWLSKLSVPGPATAIPRCDGSADPTRPTSPLADFTAWAMNPANWAGLPGSLSRGIDVDGKGVLSYDLAQAWAARLGRPLPATSTTKPVPGWTVLNGIAGQAGPGDIVITRVAGHSPHYAVVLRVAPDKRVMVLEQAPGTPPPRRLLCRHDPGADPAVDIPPSTRLPPDPPDPFRGVFGLPRGYARGMQPLRPSGHRQCRHGSSRRWWWSVGGVQGPAAGPGGSFPVAAAAPTTVDLENQMKPLGTMGYVVESVPGHPPWKVTTILRRATENRLVPPATVHPCRVHGWNQIGARPLQGT